MDTQDSVLSALVSIVGEDYVSNRPEELYLYSRDSGVREPRSADYVVMPKTVEEIQKIVLLANTEKIAITPMGGRTYTVCSYSILALKSR